MLRDPSKALSCFLSISRAIAGQMDYKQVLEKIGDELKHLVPHDHLDIVLLMTGGNQICYEVGLLTAWSNLADPVKPTATSPIRRLLRGETPFMLTEDAWSDERFHFEGADDGPIYSAELRSRIVVSLRVQGAVIGSLSISSHETGAYNRDQVEILQDTADLLAPYLYALARGEEARKAAVAESEARAREEMLRVGALRLTEGMERERQRLGMDLHDQTLADLTRLSRRIAQLRGQDLISAGDLTPVEEDLVTYLDELRGIIEDMKPGVLQLFGFAEAVDAHLRRCVADAHPPVAADVRDRTDGLIDGLTETIRTALYRIVQEATNNAVRHAGARRVAVAIERSGRLLRLTVEDDGVGIERDGLSSTGGIDHMETRAALIAARISIRKRQPEPGTRVSIELDLDEPARNAVARASAEPLAV